MIEKTWYKCRCSVCGEEFALDEKILQPSYFVCSICQKNAKQMLSIKKFAKEVNVKIDFGVMKENEIKEVHDLILEADNGKD